MFSEIQGNNISSTNIYENTINCFSTILLGDIKEIYGHSKLYYSDNVMDSYQNISNRNNHLH